MTPQARPSTPPAPPSGQLVDRVIAGVAAWLVPGAGHWLLGRRGRAVVIGVALLGLFWFGESALGGHMAVSRQVSPIFFICQVGNGLSALTANHFWGEPTRSMKVMEPDPDMPPHFHLGILFTTVSGLLNMLAVLHVLDPRTWEASSAPDSPGEGGPS